ncbi:MAG: DUF397 domain-containing protein [Nocardiopsaceae bacterium]|nr:DUF397 domain-containing protein [Nocardiopsaceae bacterium]
MRRKGGPEWHKSSYSGAQGSCVEVAEGEAVLVRDTQNRGLGHIEYSTDAWTAFLRDLKTDGF